jgi:DNA-binding transcriptional MerR regulator
VTTESLDNLMPIGRFAKSCRLSIKALRHYGEQGLLAPAFIDPQTGYRYYRRSQAQTAVMIGMLRALDMPLPTIRELLESEPATLTGILDRQADRLLRELTHKQQALAAVQRLRQEQSLMPYEVAFRREPQREVTRRTIETCNESILKDSSAEVEHLIAAAIKVSDVLPELVMCINEDPDADGRIKVDICIDAAPEHECIANTEPATIEGGPVAWCLHCGAYDTLGLAYHTVFATMQARGHTQSGAMREIYLNDPADTPVEQLLTEVIVPITTD